MKVLCLYNNPCAAVLFDWLHGQGHEIVTRGERLSAEWCAEQQFDLAVSYTYRYILSEDILEALHFNAVNLHNSFLPWNRGADPNLWSILERTPRGVTLHYMDAGLDKGGIIAQQFVPLQEKDTLKTSYDALDQAAKDLFKEAFAYYPYWREMEKIPKGKGTYHSLRDGEPIKEGIESYDTTIRALIKGCPWGGQPF